MLIAIVNVFRLFQKTSATVLVLTVTRVPNSGSSNVLHFYIMAQRQFQNKILAVRILQKWS